MASTIVSPPGSELEPCLVLDRIDYSQYEAINNAIVDRHNPRMIYAEGRLVLLTTSRVHDWFAELLGDLVKAVATGLGLEWAPSGQATHRHPSLDAGIEGDRVFYLGESAVLMAGPIDIDLSTQPPPELAIEVEHTRSADHALRAWGRIGVREVWRFHVASHAASFWSRRPDGSYERIEVSSVLHPLRPSDVEDSLSQAEHLGGTSQWLAQLPLWVRETLLPRLDSTA